MHPQVAALLAIAALVFLPAPAEARPATPLAGSHAQSVRLALSIDAGPPVEQPRIVAARYVSR